MGTFINVLRARVRSVFSKSGCSCSGGFAFVLLLSATTTAIAQSPTSQPEPPATAPATPTQANQPATLADTQGRTKPAGADDKNPTLSAGAFSIGTTGGEINEDQLKQMLAGKTLYLRGGYQDNNLEFDELGRLTGHSLQGSFTLSQIQINKVKLSKHKLELEGDRYALHFLGAAPYEDPTKATDRVKITPKKKTVRISFDREQVETPKKKKEKHRNKDKDGDLASAKVEPKGNTTSADDSSAALDTVAASVPEASDTDGDHRSKSKSTTTSAAQAAQLLLTALDKVFSQGIDDRMIASMPDFWKLYYQAAEAKADIKPVGAGIYSEDNVDQKAKLISVLDPPSNEFAQANGVAGMAMYRAIVGSDGKVGTVVAGRPIGFGLDENAENSIRKAIFQPAMKEGKPVPVALDLIVSFRIYSKRTSEPAPQEAEEKPNQPTMPGPYTVQGEQAQTGAAPQNQTSKSPQGHHTPQ